MSRWSRCSRTLRSIYSKFEKKTFRVWSSSRWVVHVSRFERPISKVTFVIHHPKLVFLSRVYSTAVVRFLTATERQLVSGLFFNFLASNSLSNERRFVIVVTSSRPHAPFRFIKKNFLRTGSFSSSTSSPFIINITCPWYGKRPWRCEAIEITQTTASESVLLRRAVSNGRTR